MVSNDQRLSTPQSQKEQHQQILDQRPPKQDTDCLDHPIIQVINSFNIQHAYQYVSGSRAKPWDDRELDVLEGIKTISFVFTTISQTAFYLVETNMINLFNVFQVQRLLPVSTFIQSNLAMENFLFLSVFILTYRCFQIMDAKGGRVLSLKDIVKIYLRKLLRLAIPYYIMWFLLWCITSRLVKGPIAATSSITFMDCKEDWIYTALFVGNLYPTDMRPYEGCFQQAFPLQLDL